MHGHLIEHLSVPGWKAGYVQTMFTLRGRFGSGHKDRVCRRLSRSGLAVLRVKKKTTKTEGGQSSTGLERNRAL